MSSLKPPVFSVACIIESGSSPFPPQHLRVWQGRLLECWHRAGSACEYFTRRENVDFQNRSERSTPPVTYAAVLFAGFVPACAARFAFSFATNSCLTLAATASVSTL